MTWTAAQATDGTGNWIATGKNADGTMYATVTFASADAQTLAQKYVVWQGRGNGTTYP
jgi:hypothetical protein